MKLQRKLVGAKMMETVEGAKKTMDIVNIAISHIIEKASDEGLESLFKSCDFAYSENVSF